jgi:hypothetical protein
MRPALCANGRIMRAIRLHAEGWRMRPRNPEEGERYEEQVHSLYVRGLPGEHRRWLGGCFRRRARLPAMSMMPH